VPRGRDSSKRVSMRVTLGVGRTSVLTGWLRSGHDPGDVRIFPVRRTRCARAFLSPLLPLLLLVPLPILTIFFLLAFGRCGRHKIVTLRQSGKGVDSDGLRPRTTPSDGEGATLARACEHRRAMVYLGSLRYLLFPRTSGKTHSAKLARKTHGCRSRRVAIHGSRYLRVAPLAAPCVRTSVEP
jgi:hypothetical protein